MEKDEVLTSDLTNFEHVDFSSEKLIKECIKVSKSQENAIMYLVFVRNPKNTQLYI